MSSTEAYIGNGEFNKELKYQKYLFGRGYNYLINKYKSKNLDITKKFPNIWNYDFIKINNCCICSSVIIKKQIIDKVGDFIIVNKEEDYDYWLRALKFTNCVFINLPLVYYDSNHGNGRLY